MARGGVISKVSHNSAQHTKMSVMFFQVFVVIGFLGSLTSFNSSVTASQGNLAYIFNYLFLVTHILDFFLLLYISRWSKTSLQNNLYSHVSKTFIGLLLIKIIFDIIYTLLSVVNTFTRNLDFIQIAGTLLSIILGVYFIFIQIWGRNWMVALSSLK